MIAEVFLTPRECKFVRWYDYLWLLMPIAGIAFFVAVVTARSRR